MEIIGLTGGMASGKSTVARALAQAGLGVFDADQASRDAVAQGSPGLRAVEAALGPGYLTAAGGLDRPKVAALIFHDRAARQRLEAVIHRLVWQQAQAFIVRQRQAGARAVVLDVPLLIECGWQRHCSQVWLVVVSREQQLERAMARDGMSREQAEARLQAQLSLEEKAAAADVLIDNRGSLAATLEQVAGLLRGLGLGQPAGEVTE